MVTVRVQKARTENAESWGCIVCAVAGPSMLVAVEVLAEFVVEIDHTKTEGEVETAHIHKMALSADVVVLHVDKQLVHMVCDYHIAAESHMMMDYRSS